MISIFKKLHSGYKKREALSYNLLFALIKEVENINNNSFLKYEKFLLGLDVSTGDFKNEIRKLYPHIDKSRDLFLIPRVFFNKHFEEKKFRKGTDYYTDIIELIDNFEKNTSIKIPGVENSEAVSAYIHSISQFINGLIISLNDIKKSKDHEYFLLPTLSSEELTEVFNNNDNLSSQIYTILDRIQKIASLSASELKEELNISNLKNSLKEFQDISKNKFVDPKLKSKLKIIESFTSNFIRLLDKMDLDLNNVEIRKNDYLKKLDIFINYFDAILKNKHDIISDLSKEIEELTKVVHTSKKLA